MGGDRCIHGKGSKKIFSEIGALRGKQAIKEKNYNKENFNARIKKKKN